MNVNNIINNLKFFFEEINISYCISKKDILIYMSKDYHLIDKNCIKDNIYTYQNKYFQKIIEEYNFDNESYTIKYFFEVSNFITRIINLENENKKLKKDSITGLATRSEIENYVTTLSKNAIIVMCDIDNFKKVNDVYGHSKGDKVLKELGNIIKEETQSDTHKNFAGRYGGEEFLIIFDDCDNLELIKNKIDYINYRFRQCNITPTLSFSAGISLFTKNKHIKKAIEEADLALYEAKKTGKNKSVIYTDKLSNKKTGI